ncbi:MAG: hypothetical protein ACKV2V_00925 [Blastocatellia bacterium]
MRGLRVILLPALLLCCGVAVVAQQMSARDRTRIEREVMKTLDDYMETWNQKDLAGWEATFHFPHYRLASGQMRVLERPGMQDATKVWAGITDWHHSRWDRRRIVHISADKVHVDTRFTRYRADGSRIGSYDSLYIVTREGGRWGVKMRSSFAQ